MKEEVVILFIMTMFVISAVALLITAMNNRRRLREMEFRERLAMIERGLAPPPERDPAGFEATMPPLAPPERRRGGRYRTAGIAMIGFGLGLVVLLTFTGANPDMGLGLGGAWVMLGAALLFNYFLITREDMAYAERERWSTRPPRGGPPSAS